MARHWGTKHSQPLPCIRHSLDFVVLPVFFIPTAPRLLQLCNFLPNRSTCLRHICRSRWFGQIKLVRNQSFQPKQKLKRKLLSQTSLLRRQKGELEALGWHRLRYSLRSNLPNSLQQASPGNAGRFKWLLRFYRLEWCISTGLSVFY